VSFRNGSGPEAAATVLEARKNVGIGNAAPSKPSPDNSQVIRVTLTGSDTCTAGGLTGRGHAPILATVRDIVEKSEAGYTKVQTDLVVMRRADDLPYEWLADNTRWQRKPRTFHSVEQALSNTAKFYRKDLWADADAYVEIWLGKDALAGMIYPITSRYDVPLMVARGYASLSFLHRAAEYINDLEVPTYIYHLGDFDPSGVNAGEKIEETLMEIAPDAEIYFERIAVNRDQIAAWNLPTRPTQSSDSRSRRFGNISVERDAINFDRLCALVQGTIERHLPPRQFEVLKAAKASERKIITKLVGGLGS
jgi:hypothetical protein